MIDKRAAIAAQIDGGGQERGLRSGTLNVPGIVGFGARGGDGRGRNCRPRRRASRRCAIACWQRLRAQAGRGDGERRDRRRGLPGNLNVSFAGVDGEALLLSLDDMAVSSGAACTQAEPSHVLMALGLSKDRALASLRFGLGRGRRPPEMST